MPVPKNWNQSSVSKVKRGNYSVHVVLASKPPAEASYGKLAIGSGKTAGYLIPGAAILSPESPHGRDPNYCAYNMLIADAVCSAALKDCYEVTAGDCQVATTRHQVFRQNAYYLITWNDFFKSQSTFAKDYALSLCNFGLVLSASDEFPSQLYAEYVGGGETMRLKPTPSIPSYIATILGELVPYCKNPFLRFFYLYQVVEYLMGIEFDNKVASVRGNFIANEKPSMVEFRDMLEKFQEATREKARINVVLSPICPTTQLLAEDLLAALNVQEAGLNFAEKIYRIRNTLFHDYGQLHCKGEQVSSLCQHFFEYLVAKKLLV